MKKNLKMISPLNSNDDMPIALFIIKKLLAFILIYFISMLLAEVIVIGIHYILGYNVLQGEMMSIEAMTLLKYYGYAVFMIVAMLYCKLIEKRTIKSMGFNNKVVGYLKGILISIILLLISIGLIFMTGNITYNGVSNNINYPIIILFLGAFIVQGAMEETLCRGFLMTSLMKKVPTFIAILVSSLAFSVPHFPSLFTGGFTYGLVGVINLLLVSIIFSLLVIIDNNIWIACGMHSLWNFFLLNVFGLSLSGSDNSSNTIFSFSTSSQNIINGGSYGIEASIITIAVLTAFTVILILRYMKTLKKVY